uniref:Cathepsin propeptide inhibitor domain-containing protein n=1 Tax=Glossina pallidipes TaxID=7398 RepID=A0A1A9ZN32_GLOPL
MKCLMCLMASIGLMLLMSSSLSVEAKKPKKYIGENGGDFEFIDETIWEDLCTKFRTKSALGSDLFKNLLNFTNGSNRLDLEWSSRMRQNFYKNHGEELKIVRRTRPDVKAVESSRKDSKSFGGRRETNSWPNDFLSFH